MANRNKVITEAFGAMVPDYERIVDAELQRFWHLSYEDLLSELLGTMEDLHPQRILDVATGTGAIPVRILKGGKLPGVVFALDLTLPMLIQARSRLSSLPGQESPRLTCASAMAIPLEGEAFDLLICALAAHHLDLPQALAEFQRVLRPGGSLVMVDVAASPKWRKRWIRWLIKAGTFLYFLLAEGLARARIEAQALENIRTAAEWDRLLQVYGFTDIRITKAAVDRSWIPGPLFIRAVSAPGRVLHAD